MMKIENALLAVKPAVLMKTLSTTVIGRGADNSLDNSSRSLLRAGKLEDGRNL